LGYIAPAFGRFPVAAWLPYSLFAGNWYICTHDWSVTYPTGPFWSISVEEQFYILIPLLAAYGSKRLMKIIAFVFIATAYLFIIYYGLHPTDGFTSEWTNSFVQFQFFAAGMLLSFYLKGRRPQWTLVSRLLILLAGVGCWLVANMVFHVQADAPHLSNSYEAVGGWLLVLLGTLLMFFSLLGTPGRYLPKPLIYLGRISYGMYIFHALMLWLVFHVCKEELAGICKALHLEEWQKTVGSILVFAFTVLVSMLSYRFFERPFLSLKRRFTFVPSRD